MSAPAPQPTTSLKLDPELRDRLRRLAEARRRTPHWLMREAIAQYVDREEARERLRADPDPSVRAEVAALKAMTAIYVMNRAGADVEYARQREMLTELVAALVAAGGRELEPWIAPEFDAAADDGGRLRVVIDQVASLTDASAVAWHARLCR